MMSNPEKKISVEDITPASNSHQQYGQAASSVLSEHPNGEPVTASPAPPAPRQKVWQYFSADDTPAERRLILKLDGLIIVFLFLAYWAKVLDQSATSTAYVSGMKEDLSLYGNELNYLNTVFQ
jgi:hypothetical protein